MASLFSLQYALYLWKWKAHINHKAPNVYHYMHTHMQFTLETDHENMCASDCKSSGWRSK